jgi:transporter family-2 protein
MLNLTLIAAAVIGFAFAAQPAINAAAGQVLGSALPATVLSVGITFLASASLMIVSGTTPPAASLGLLPWWIALGGLIGVLVVAGGASIVPITGVALFFVCFIAGQLFGSVMMDHIGAFGLVAREATPLRLAGVGLAFLGVLLVRFG